MSVNISASQFAQNWSQGVSAGGQRYQQGVQNVQSSPGAAAAAQKSVWVANTTAAADKWAAAVGNVSLQDWKQQTLNFGTSAYTASAAKGQSKVQAFASAYIPFLQQAVAQLPARGNRSANQARYQAMQNAFTSFNYSKRTL